MIINDVKEDWYDDENKSPRFELLKEFNSITGNKFWTCTMKEFLHLMNKNLKEEEQISDEVLQEVIDVQQQKDVGCINDNEYRVMLQNWFINSMNQVKILKEVAIEDEWRIFQNGVSVRIFEGEDSEENSCLIVLNLIIGSPAYAKVLHAVQSPFEIKKYYDEKGIEKKYYQVTLTKTKEATVKMLNQLNKPNPTKYYKRKEVKTSIGYIDELGEIVIIENNM